MQQRAGAPVRADEGQGEAHRLGGRIVREAQVDPAAAQGRDRQAQAVRPLGEGHPHAFQILSTVSFTASVRAMS